MSVDVVFASGPTYRSGQNDFLMPFTYYNGRLDLPSSNPASYPSGTEGVAIGNAGASIRILGGANQVTSIGPNLQAFIKATTWDGYTVSGNITVASPGIVTRVQQLSSQYLAPTWDQKAYKITPNAWNGANFIGSAPVFLFNKPLVIQATGTRLGTTSTVCITFQTYWDN